MSADRDGALREAQVESPSDCRRRSKNWSVATLEKVNTRRWSVITVEDWALIRGLAAEGVPTLADDAIEWRNDFGVAKTQAGCG